VEDLRLKSVDLFVGEVGDASAGRASFVPDAEDGSKLQQGEADGQRAADEQDAVEGLGRVATIAALGPRWLLEET